MLYKSYLALLSRELLLVLIWLIGETLFYKQINQVFNNFFHDINKAQLHEMSKSFLI